MKPEIAQRATTCHYCKEPISPGSRRLTDTYKVYTNKTTSGYTIIRRHFHFRRLDPFTEEESNCYDDWAHQQFERMPIKLPFTNNPNGRTKLDITDDERVLRNKLLRALSNQFNYYIRDGHLYMVDKNSTNITQKKLDKVERFKSNIQTILVKLNGVGGIPTKYLHWFESELENVVI